MTKPLTESGQTLTSYGLFYHHVMKSWIVDGWLYYIHDNHRITDVVCKDSWIPSAASLREVEAQVTLTSACGRPSWIVVTFPVWRNDARKIEEKHLTATTWFQDGHWFLDFFGGLTTRIGKHPFCLSWKLWSWYGQMVMVKGWSVRGYVLELHVV